MKIIAIEGLDKSGKHTISERLAQHLKEQGFKVAKSEFGRYDTPTGKMIMNFLKGDKNIDNFTHQVLLYSNKQEQQAWFNQLEQEHYDYLILDRYTFSQFVYGNYFIQEDYYKGLTQPAQYKHQLDSLLAMSNGALRVPDINIILDVTPETSMARKGQHGDNDRYESNKLLLSSVRNHYLALGTTRLDTAVVWAEDDLDTVFENTLEALYQSQYFVMGYETSVLGLPELNLKEWLQSETLIEHYEQLKPFDSYPVSSLYGNNNYLAYTTK